MAADLHIHIFEGITEEDLRLFFTSSLGSKHFNMAEAAIQQRLGLQTHEKVGDTPNTWIGEVSWLKAMILEDPEEFVPTPVSIIHELIGEDLPILDSDLIYKIIDALDHENTTMYRITRPEDVIGFLSGHEGKQVFTVSW